MTVNLEQIEMLRERAHVSYGEAKEVLEKFNGDVLEALIYLEGQSKVRTARIGAAGSECGLGKTTKGFFKSVGRLIKKGNEIRFVVNKAERTVVDIPVNIVILTAVLAFPVAVAGVVLALLTSHRISFRKSDGRDMEINKTLDKISDAMTSVSNQVAGAVKTDQQ
ncbi:MAG: ubiquitin [Firmicutes bacterium HGW-Firmicutes-14]|nr:MAG: ubiquitin [Firmicutes bacterium HGW-Firmicutes-14]